MTAQQPAFGVIPGKVLKPERWDDADDAVKIGVPSQRWDSFDGGSAKAMNDVRKGGEKNNGGKNNGRKSTAMKRKGEERT